MHLNSPTHSWVMGHRRIIHGLCTENNLTQIPVELYIDMVLIEMLFDSNDKYMEIRSISVVLINTWVSHHRGLENSATQPHYQDVERTSPAPLNALFNVHTPVVTPH
jgi:hypothetical protein